MGFLYITEIVFSEGEVRKGMDFSSYVGLEATIVSGSNLIAFDLNLSRLCIVTFCMSEFHLRSYLRLSLNRLRRQKLFLREQPFIAIDENTL